MMKPEDAVECVLKILVGDGFSCMNTEDSIKGKTQLIKDLLDGTVKVESEQEVEDKSFEYYCKNSG